MDQHIGSMMMGLSTLPFIFATMDAIDIGSQGHEDTDHKKAFKAIGLKLGIGVVLMSFGWVLNHFGI